MKVLHIINSFDIGGAEKLLYNYMIETNNNEFNHIGILKECDSFLYKELKEKGVNFIYLYNKNPILKLLKLIKIIRNEKYKKNLHPKVSGSLGPFRT